MSSSPKFLRANYGDLYGSSMLPVLEEIFRSNLELHPSRREALFQIKRTDRDIYQSTELHDMPQFNQMSEGEDYSFNSPKQGSSKTIVPVKYGLGFSISEEAVEDGKMDFIADAVRKLAESARESQEVSAMNILNNGFSSETTADGVAVFSTVHTLPSGSTFRNRLSTDADLSVTSLETMLLDFETQFIGDTGIIKRMVPKMLVVHPSNKRLAKELIGSDLKVNSVVSGADNGPTNAMNSYKEEGLSVISSPHLTDADAWFMICEPEKNGLRIISRKPIETKAGGMDSGYINDSILYKSRYREKIAAIHPYGVFGTSGA